MKKFFNKIVLFIKSLFINADNWIHQHVQPSIETAQRLKAILDNPFADLVVALIPGTIDDKAKAFALEYLTKAINVLHITNDIVNDPDWASKIQKTVNYIRTLSPSLQKGFFMRLTSEMAKISAGSESDKVKGHSIDLLVQMQYSKLKEGLKAEDLPSETIVNGELQPTTNQ